MPKRGEGAELAKQLGVSRQRAWQILRRHKGLCIQCGKPAAKKGEKGIKKVLDKDSRFCQYHLVSRVQ